MPDQNQFGPNQNSQQSNGSPVQQPTVTPPVVFPQSDLPPLPPAFQNLSEPDSPAVTAPAVNSSTVQQPANTNTGSDTPPEIPPTVSKPKKKFGSGKIIASILGLIILVVGVGAGIILTQQRQLLQPKANTLCACGATAYTGETCADVCPGNTSTNPNCGGSGQYDCSCADGTTGYVCKSGTVNCTDFCQGHNGSGNGGGTSCGSGSVVGCQGKSVGTVLSACGYDSTGHQSSGGTYGLVCQSTGSNGSDGLPKCNANWFSDSACTGGATGTSPKGCESCSASSCHCSDIDCKQGMCDTSGNDRNTCISEGRSWCANSTNNGMTCCAAGYKCASGSGCTPVTTNPSSPPNINHTPTPKPTPTKSPTPKPTPTKSPTPKPTPTKSPTPKPTPTKSPTPTPTKSPIPTPSQSPSPVLSCSGLSKDISQPVYGDTVTFSCSTNYSGGTPYAAFRWNYDGGAWQTFPNVPNYSVDPITHKATFTLTIDHYAVYVVQCQICTNQSMTTCTQWGQAN